MNVRIRALFPEVNSGARPTTQQRYASIAFDCEEQNTELIEFIRFNRALFADAFISIWGAGKVSWGQYFVPESVLEMVKDLDLGLEVGFGTGAKNNDSTNAKS